MTLPTQKEREKIFNVHLKKIMKNSTVNHEITASDEICRELANASVGYVGAEIEQIVIAAMYEAFYADRGLRKEDILKSLRETVPLSSTQREQILALREWAKERAVLATAVEDRDVVSADDGDGDDGDFVNRQGGRIVDFDL